MELTIALALSILGSVISGCKRRKRNKFRIN